jgi:nitroreductase
MTDFNDTSSAARLLATRRSGKARDMAAPGPDAGQRRAILEAAMRVPDHGKLAPWRFVTVGDAERPAFAERLVAALRTDKPEATNIEVETTRSFALHAPWLVIVLSRPVTTAPIPVWEQELSAGAATMLLCLAAHAQGFAANWLTGWATYSDAVMRLVGEPGERIAGFVFIGTPVKPLEERPRPAFDAVVREWRG